MAYGTCETCQRFAFLRKSKNCYRCDPSKSGFKQKSEGVPGSDKVELHFSFNDLGLFTSLETLRANGASTRDMISWLRNGDYSRKINHADIQRILDGKFPRLPKKREALRLRPYSLVDPCPDCNKPHTHAHGEVVYPAGTLTYDGATQEVKPIETKVHKKRYRIAIHKQDMHSASKSITHNIATYRVRELHTLLTEYLEWADPENEPAPALHGQNGAGKGASEDEYVKIST